MECPLCSSNSTHFCHARKRDYFRCSSCRSVFLNPSQRLNLIEERERYLRHENNIESEGYQNFIKPLVDAVKVCFGPGHSGLDYGAGPGPVAAFLLEKDGYRISKYDPFFYPDRGVLNYSYDYIICSEVIEHFFNPFTEFAKLRSLLNPAGKLFCYTQLLNDSVEFETWHYISDPTHVFFYHRKALEFISQAFRLTFGVKERLVIFSAQAA